LVTLIPAVIPCHSVYPNRHMSLDVKVHRAIQLIMELRSSEPTQRIAGRSARLCWRSIYDSSGDQMQPFYGKFFTLPHPTSIKARQSSKYQSKPASYDHTSIVMHAPLRRVTCPKMVKKSEGMSEDFSKRIGDITNTTFQDIKMSGKMLFF